MLQYCARLETGDKKSERGIYEKIYKDIKDWYIKQHHEFELMLKNELVSQLCNNILEQDEQDLLDISEYLGITGLSDNWQSKLDLYSAVDIMCKQILSKFSYGPESSMPVSFKKSNCSWLSCKLEVHHMYELLQMQLESNNCGQRINLSVLMEERTVRSKLTHSGEISVCLSAIRCYNVLREMIVLMDNDQYSLLPRFEYPEIAVCDMQKFLSYTNRLNFSEEQTVLVVGSLHDIMTEGKAVLANLPWTVVLDFDGYSAFGGLRSCVDHQYIHDQKLTKATIGHYTPVKGYTTWFTCGDFCNYRYTNVPRDSIYFSTKQPFESNYYSIDNKIRDIFSDLMSILSQQLKPINVVFLHNEKSLAKDLLAECGKYYLPEQYTFTSIYYYPQAEWDEKLSELNPRYRGSKQLYFWNTLSCSLDSFFDGLIEYESAFPTQNAVPNINMLPSEDGLKQISNNTALNLGVFFDVLYSNCGEAEYEEAQKSLADFYHGGLPSWAVFRHNGAILLMGKNTYEQKLEMVRDALRRMPEKSGHKIINIIHSPGIGGSTLLRQIGWDLHLEYPVMLVRKYDNQISSLIMQLYDELKKGILIIADETINEIDKLKEDIKKTPRACALVVAGRAKHLVVGKNEREIPFNTIRASSESELQDKFKEYSNLTPAEKQNKDYNYSTFINQSPFMKCPFIIGLYYLDKSFNGIDDYVNQIMKSISETREIETAAMIALCDYYGQIGLPRILVDNNLGIPPRNDYLRTHHYAESAFIQSTEHGDVPVYRSKHYLISLALLEKCCQSLYGSTLTSSLSAISEIIINAIHAECQRKFSGVYQSILERLFIDKSYNQQSFSQLILEIPLPISRKHVLECLASKFKALALSKSPCEAIEIYCMAAHFYGHLGRLCSKRDGGVENVEDAKLYAKEAVDLMEAVIADNPDPLIYHMYGEACKNYLRKKLDEQIDKPTPSKYEFFESIIEETSSIFDQAAECGSEEYSSASKLGMYIMYLKRVYLWEKIDRTERITRLSTTQAGYRKEIEELIVFLSERPMNETTQDLFQRYKNEYRSQIMMNNYSVAIQYYENLLAQLENTAGRDIEIQEARRGLISVRMSRFNEKASKNEDIPIEMDPKELNSVLDLLEQTLAQSIDIHDYRKYNQRMGGYSQWFYLAKMRGSNRSVHKALFYAQRWNELALQAKTDDPRPAYYLYILSVLSLLDGNKTSKEDIKKYRKQCYDLATRARYKTDIVRDILVDGVGLSRLMDMRHAKNSIKYLENSGRSPIVLEGIFEEIAGGKGIISIQKPINLAKETIRFNLGTVDRSNTIGQRQLSHTLGSFVGFSYERFEAIDKYVRDYSAQEPKPIILKDQNRNRTTNIVCQIDKNLVVTKKSAIFTDIKITSRKGLAGVVCINNVRYPATMPKSEVTPQMLNEAEKIQNLQIPVLIDGISPQGDRYLLKKKN